MPSKKDYSLEKARNDDNIERFTEEHPSKTNRCLLGKVWSVIITIGLILIIGLIYLIAFIPSWIVLLLLGLLGGFILVLVVGRLIIWRQGKTIDESQLLLLHKQMIFYTGDISNHAATYKDILKDLRVGGKPDGWINKHRRELQVLKYLTYSSGIVELTDKGLILFDKWLKQGKEFKPSKNSKTGGQT